MMHIYETVAIFRFFPWWPTPIFCFHQHSENQRPKLLGGGGELVIWFFSVWCIFMKWQPFFKFFIMANASILFLSTLRKTRDPNFEEISNLKCFCVMHIYQMVAIVLFFPQNFGRWLIICNFSIQRIFMKWWRFLNFFRMTFLHLKVHNG